MAEERALAHQSVLGPLVKTETATVQTAIKELNKQLEGQSRDGDGSRTTADGHVVSPGTGTSPFMGPVVGPRQPSFSTAEEHIRFKHNTQASFSQQVGVDSTNSEQFTALPAPMLPAPASSVGSQGDGDNTNGKRNRPRLFVNTNVDAGLFIGHGPPASDGASATAAAITAARSAARVVSHVSHTPGMHQTYPPRMGSSAAAAAAAAAEAAARYSGGMATMGHPSMPPMHHHHHLQQQQQQQHAAVIGRGNGARGCGGEYPIAIPGTSVRRYMHVQLLLALMSAPGLSVVAPAKVSWDRLGYYPVDAVFGPPAPGAPLNGPPKLTPPASSVSGTPPRIDDSVAPPPPKRVRSVKEPGSGSVHDTISAGRTTNTGAMAMPPPQHSPRTSAMLSGLPVGSEGAMMLGDAGELHFSSTSPTSFMGMGSMGPMSPYQFPSTGVGGGLLGGGGGGGSSDGGGSACDPNQHFDFAAAMGGIGGGGSQGMVPSFADFASIYSPTPVSPTFGAGRLSPLAGVLSPQSLSPRVNWASGFQGFPS